MAKILLVISIVITLLTAGLGFMTKNKVDLLQSTLSSTKNELSSTKSTLENTKKDLNQTKEELTTTTKNLEDSKTKLTAAETERDDAKKKADDLQTQITDRDAQIAKLSEDIKAAMGGTPQGDATIGGQIKEMQDQLNRAVAERDELKAVQETLNARVAEADQRAQQAQVQVKRYESGIARQSLQGRILAVNQGWNFVVLDVGDRQGATVGAPLLVLRGGQPVARLKITSVEPSTAIADVVAGSTMRGTTVQPGDRVVFAGARNQTPQQMIGTVPAAPLPIPRANVPPPQPEGGAAPEQTPPPVPAE
jgi:hypothetical protein